jgi:glutamine amidotransferase
VSSRVTLVDYGMGNLPNVARAFARAGARADITSDPAELRRAERVVVPGVGASGDAMAALRASGMDAALREWIGAGRPYLGICLGMQLLLETAEEGDAECLGIVPGRVALFPSSLGLRVPHMGWNLVKPERPHPVLEEGYFYFVHSYRATGVPQPFRLARTDYGEEFPSAIGRDNYLGVQFHPEKSQRAGLALLERFCRWSP